MNLKPALIVSGLFCTQQTAAQSPGWLWADRSGSTGQDYAYSIATDASSNVYATGFFTGVADFDPGPGIFNLSSSGLEDIYITKIDALGNFVWAVKMGGTDDDYGSSIALDASGNVYITGSFRGTADFDPGAGTFNLTAAGGWDVFVAKYDGSGNFAWAKSMGGPNTDRCSSIGIDAIGNVYTTGFFMGTADFDPGMGVYNLTAAATTDIFISKLDGAGNFVWARAIGGTAGVIYSYSLALDASGNVYTTGDFWGTIDFDPGPGTFDLTPVGVWDIFISKLDASGNFVWAKQMGGSGSGKGYSSIASDASGNVYTTGFFYGTVDFDPGAGSFNLVSASAVAYDIFISKLDGSGTFIWAKAVGGVDADYAYSIVLDPAGNVYTTGGFSGTVDFDPGPGTFILTSAGDYDIFVSKLDVSGNFAWAKAVENGTGTDLGQSIAVDASGNIYLAGSFYSPLLVFGSTTLTNAGSMGSTADIFIAKLGAIPPLPVELLSFYGKPYSGRIILEWTTAGELNNDYFSIGRSRDGNAFEEIGRVKGAGNSTQSLSYSFVDDKPDAGMNYYRLKQVDYNGEFNYSPILAVRNMQTGNSCFVITGEGSGNYILRCVREGVQAQVLSAEGKILSIIERTDRPETDIDISVFPKGWYLLKTIDEKEIQVFKLAKE